MLREPRSRRAAALAILAAAVLAYLGLWAWRDLGVEPTYAGPWGEMTPTSEAPQTGQN